MICFQLDWQSLQALSLVSRSFNSSVTLELQKRVVPDNNALVKACEEGNLELALHLLSPVTSSYTRTVGIVLKSELPQVIFGSPDTKECLPGCQKVITALITNQANVDVDVNGRDKEGRTALHNAIISHAPLCHVEKLVEVLVNGGVDVNAQDSVGCTALHYVFAESGRVEYLHSKNLLSKLLASPANANIKDIHGRTALHYAILTYAPLPHIEQLLQSSDLKVLDREENTLLHCAASMLDPEIIAMLLQHHPNVNSTNTLGDTPLHNLARAGEDRANSLLPPDTLVECMELLLNGGANPNISGHDGDPVLHILTRIRDKTAPNAVKLLLDSDANPNLRSTYGTPLHEAVEENNPELVNLLIGYGAYVDACNHQGFTPLHCACEVPIANLEVIKSLLKNSADANAINNEGNTPLHIASWPCESAPECVQLLLEYGADPNTHDGRGATALHRAVHEPLGGPAYQISLQLTKLLLKHEANPNIDAKVGRRIGSITPMCRPLHVASALGNRDAVRLLLDAGGDPGARDRRGRTPLHIAKHNRPNSPGQLDCACLLLDPVL